MNFQQAITLNPHQKNDQAPAITAVIAYDGNELFCTFTLNSPNPLQLPNYADGQVVLADFLWEKDCLELFIAGDFLTNCPQNIAYFEINISPDGRYALYEFQGYRTPNTLPPPKSQALSLTWQQAQLNQLVTDTNTTYYQSIFAIKLRLPDGFIPTAINPTAILYPKIHGESVLYYANQHTTPPDFHQQTQWIPL